MKKIAIQTKKPYDIYLGEGILDNTGKIVSELGNYKNIAIVTDDIVEKLYLQEVVNSFASDVKISTYTIPHGEQSKDISMLSKLYEFFIESDIKRSDLIIALGGGVVGDLVGFASSSFLRGVKFLQIPTTLLAQVDSSVGGKTAINIPAGKNLVGAFYQPIAVICDIKTLSTLGDKIFSDGMAEVIKYGCIWDKDLFYKLYDIEKPNVLAEVVEACIKIKAEVVSQDEFDTGLRMILNFGHTIGHAVEKHFGFSGYSHGQGVAVGMAKITMISESLGLTEKGTYCELVKILKHFNLPYECTLETDEIFTVSGHDKKGVNGFINLIIIKGLGDTFIHKISFDEYRAFLETKSTVLFPKSKATIEGNCSLNGEIQIPASKSIMHRAIICATLSDAPSTVKNIWINDDVTATLNAMKEIGLEYSVDGRDYTFYPLDKSKLDFDKTYNIDCNESGSTIRFLIPVLASLGIKAIFNGKGKLPTRPLDIFTEAFKGKGVDFDYSGVLPAEISGKLQSGDYEIKGNISSQFITGLLLALPLLEGDSSLKVIAPFESKSYVDITLDVMKNFGVTVSFDEKTLTYYMKGNQSYKATDYTVESDYSSASFFLVASCLGNNHVSLSSFPSYNKSLQGDCKLIDIIKQAGAKVENNNGKLTVEHGKMQAFTVDASDIPDIVPILCVLACACNGVSKISKVERLRIKECDRIEATLKLINGLGGKAHYENDCISIEGVESLNGGNVDSFSDHRMAMCGAICATIANGEVSINNAQCVAKSYVNFFEDYNKLGGMANVINVE